MRRTIYNRLVLLLCLIATLTLSSCGDDKEPSMKDGDLIFDVQVSVIDMDGRDLVLEWYESDKETKLTEAEYISGGKYPKTYTGDLYFTQDPSDYSLSFHNSYVYGLDIKGDDVAWRFKMYDTDAEEILLEASCVSPNKPIYDVNGHPVEYCLKWSFRGITLPIPDPHFNRQKLTLVRSDDGRYTMQ